VFISYMSCSRMMTVDFLVVEGIMRYQCKDMTDDIQNDVQKCVVEFSVDTLQRKYRDLATS
jgi:hypothetical protein